MVKHREIKTIIIIELWLFQGHDFRVGELLQALADHPWLRFQATLVALIQEWNYPSTGQAAATNIEYMAGECKLMLKENDELLTPHAVDVLAWILPF
jgi:hypothetical protein